MIFKFTVYNKKMVKEEWFQMLLDKEVVKTFFNFTQVIYFVNYEYISKCLILSVIW